MSDVFGVGEATAGVAQATAMIVVATLQYKTWDKQIDKADAIARRIQDREDERHRAWTDIYKQEEIRTANEVFTAPTETVNYGAVRQRVEATYRAATDRAVSDALFFMDNQCAGARGDISRELTLRGAGLTAFGVEAALRAEELRIEVKNRQRLADKLTMINTGRQAYFSPSSALSGALQQYQFAAQQAAGAFNGALASLGALARRNQQPNGQREAGAPALQQFGADRLATGADRYRPAATDFNTPIPDLSANLPDIGGTAMSPGADGGGGGADARDFTGYGVGTGTENY